MGKNEYVYIYIIYNVPHFATYTINNPYFLNFVPYFNI